MARSTQIQKGHAGGGIMRIGAMGLMIIGAPIVILSLLGFMSAALTVGGLLFLGILGLVLFVSGLMWLRSIGQGESMTEARREEQMILDLAARHRGTLTLAQVVSESGLSANQAESILERLTSQRLLQPDLMEDGTLAYRIRGLES